MVSPHAGDITPVYGCLCSALALTLRAREQTPKAAQVFPLATPSPPVFTLVGKKVAGEEMGEERDGTREFWWGNIQPELRLASPNLDLV